MPWQPWKGCRGRKQCCVLCLDYRRTHGWMDASFRCYRSLLLTQDLDANPARPTVRSGATEEIPGACHPCTEVQGPIMCRTLKDSRGPRGKRSLRIKYQRAREAPRTCLPHLYQDEMPVPRCLSGTSIQCKFQPRAIHAPPGPYRLFSLPGPV